MKERSLVPQRSRTATTPALAQDVIDLKTATVTPAEQLEEMTNGLTVIQRFLMRRHLGKLNMEHAKKIAVAIGQAVVESTVYKLTLALDFDKKKTFMSYIHASGDLQRELQRLEAEFRNALAVELLRIDTMVSEYRKTANDQIGMMRAAGSLNEADASELSARYLNVAEGLLQENLSTYELLTGNFKELLTRTLSLFMSELRDAKLI
jgi:hypothetical protein